MKYKIAKMIPAMPTIAAAIPPTTAPVETVEVELLLPPLLPVEEGLELIEVSEGRVNEVAGTDVFRVDCPNVVEVVGVATIGVEVVEVDKELEEDEVVEVDEGLLGVVEEVEDVLGVGVLFVLVEGDWVLVEAGLSTLVVPPVGVD